MYRTRSPKDRGSVNCVVLYSFILITVTLKLYGFGYCVKIKKLKCLVSTLLKQFVGADMQVMNKIILLMLMALCWLNTGLWLHNGCFTP